MIAGAWGMLLILGVSLWIAGLIAKKPPLKKAGSRVLFSWLAYDFIIIVLAITLGWFA